MSLTLIFIISIILIITFYDVWVIFKKVKFESISAYIIRYSKQMPLVVLLFGIVLGHLFWSMDSFDYLPREEIVKRCKYYNSD